MSWLPKSPKARRRLWIFVAVAPILALAVGLSLYAMRDSVTFFFSPSEATPEKAPEGRVIRLGGLVEMGSVQRSGDGEVAFMVTDNLASTRVVYRGDLPDLFREGQGIVAEGTFDANGTFVAKQVLAKHDERYMPRDVAKALKKQGEWRGEGAGAPAYGKSSHQGGGVAAGDGGGSPADPATPPSDLRSPPPRGEDRR